jgi:acyl-CoA synthetase (NDP forming)
MSSSPESTARLRAHRLQPLLNPASVAIYGASTRRGAPGNTSVVRAGQGADSSGRRIYPINPKYEEVEGFRAYGSLADLPEVPEHVIFCVGTERMERAVTEAVEAGAKGGVIFASCYLEHDQDPKLPKRISALAREAGMALCGGNCMGFYNLHDGFLAAAFGLEAQMHKGGITLISHSGSQWGSLIHNDRRWRYNLAISAGQELATTAADYMDYALELDSTRVIGLFLETVRDPEGFVAALEKAQARDIPVVAMKLARTAEAASLAATHSGALAGNFAAYEALFDRYGVLHCQTLNEFGATLLLMSNARRVGDGGISGVLDSGGYREMLVDLASDENVPFARLSEATMRDLRARLDSDLEPGNPLDAWSSADGYEEKFTDYYRMLANDPDTAITIGFHDLRGGSPLHQGYNRSILKVAQETGKPFAICCNFTAADNFEARQELSDQGIPVLDGTVEALRAVRHAFAYRDFSRQPAAVPPSAPAGTVIESWRSRLQSGKPLDEAEGLDLIADFGLGAIAHKPATTRDETIAAAEALGFPVALKTAMPGILHKSDVGGVHLGLADKDALAKAYRDLEERLGPRVLVTLMAPRGVEMSLGIIQDAQFGPLVMVGAGGILIELLADRRIMLPPCDARDAGTQIDRLKVRPMLDGLRGQPAVDVGALADAVARLSVLAVALGDLIEGLDINPIIVHPSGCVAVDALVIPRAPVA